MIWVYLNEVEVRGGRPWRALFFPTASILFKTLHLHTFYLYYNVFGKIISWIIEAEMTQWKISSLWRLDDDEAVLPVPVLYVHIHSQSFGCHSKQKQLIEFSSEQSTDRTKGRALNTKRGSEVGDLWHWNNYFHHFTVKIHREQQKHFSIYWWQCMQVLQ